MNLKLTDEMRAAIRQRPGTALRVEDTETQKVFVLIDDETHRRAMAALRQQEDLAAIQEGIDDMEAGRYVPLEEADAEIRKEFGFSPRKP